MKTAVVSVLAMAAGVLYAVEGPESGVLEKAQMEQMAGQAVDISPWAYEWRADRAVQEKPEAYFIPHRLERLDKVYRTAYYTMTETELKGSYGHLIPGLLNPLLPQPKGRLQAGLLWVGRLADYQVELSWPAGVPGIPSPEGVEVRVFPTNFGWFGWTVDEILGKPEVSADQHTWIYPGGSATEMIAVFYEGAEFAQPRIRVISPHMGVWQRMDVEIEWGFQAAAEKSDFDGRVETYLAMAGPVAALAEDPGTKVTDGHRWQSRAAGGGRRGIVVPLLYTPGGQPALDSRVTIWTQTAGFTFRVCDLEKGPILIPEHGVFVTKAGSGKTARQFAGELAAKNLKSICQRVREHREAASWEEVMQKVRLSTCPAGTPLPPFPAVEDPAMQVQLPDARWTDAWRAASFQLKGKHMWGGLAFEVGRVAHEMDLVGLHEEADKVYQYFLESPGVKPDGDYTDGTGALEWAKNMQHDMGYNHDGTHASTGRLLFAMADRYFLTGDKEWFQKNRLRLQAAADWIIRQRKLYMKDVPNREELFAAGLMPPYMLGDYAMPSCDWRWYYSDNIFSLQGVQRFADALTEFDAEAGRHYRQEAEAFRQDIRRAVEQEAVLSPVRQGQDGLYHSFLTSTCYTRGVLTSLELGSIQRPQGDLLMGALPLAEPFGVMDAKDIRMIGTIQKMEEIATSPQVASFILTGGNGKTLDAIEGPGSPANQAGEQDDTWFWNCFGGGLAKCSHNANIYLLQDDVANFLRFWMHAYAAIVGADGKLWEWAHLGEYSNCAGPDNGTAGWFLENFRNLLVMEEGQSLWIARATPRVWLEQGKKISVKNAPTYFGTLAYEIVSDVDHGKITATVEMPDRSPVQSLMVRFRHPQAAAMKSVTVNGQPWNGFNPDQEVVEITGLTGKAVVTASY